MKTSMQFVLTVAVFAVLGCTFAEPQNAAAADEIIVKFAADQAINEMITVAFDDKTAQASLERYVQTLSEELVVPFVYSRLTSGREIVIEVPEKRVLQMIAERIRRSEGVEKVVVARRTSQETGYAVGEILVSVDSARIEIGPRGVADALAVRLVNDARFPVNGEARADGLLAITADLERIIGTLAADLTGRSDIEYAQPNYAVHHYNIRQ